LPGLFIDGVRFTAGHSWSFFSLVVSLAPLKLRSARTWPLAPRDQLCGPFLSTALKKLSNVIEIVQEKAWLQRTVWVY
jgi:hypothetical protein